MLFRKRRPATTGDPDLDEAIGERNALADVMGSLPLWIFCPGCGAQAWRVPPHGEGNPCPTMIAVADSAGLKLDAERMAAARSGAHMEALTQVMHEHFLEEEEDEE